MYSSIQGERVRQWQGPVSEGPERVARVLGGILPYTPLPAWSSRSTIVGNGATSGWRSRVASAAAVMRGVLTCGSSLLRPWLQQPSDPNVLVQVGPVKAEPATAQLVPGPLLRRPPSEQGKPVHRNRDHSTVHQLDSEVALGNRSGPRP